MTGTDEKNESQANILCKACGLCCTGHLFIWAKLRPSELDPAEALGLTVFRSDPNQRGFSQPCPLWRGECTIYDLPEYPHVCRAYKCKLLKEVIAENASLPDALRVVEQTKKVIEELDVLLPNSPGPNFRERLVAYLEELPELNTSSFEGQDRGPGLRRKAEVLLAIYEDVFGVDDLIEGADESDSG